jgi:hypothetical protein
MKAMFIVFLMTKGFVIYELVSTDQKVSQEFCL